MTALLAEFDAAPLALTLRVAGVATLAALLLGVALGYVSARTRLPGRSVLEALCMLPLVLPPTVIGYAVLVLMGRHGPVGAWLREHFDHSVIFHWHGAAIASALVALPLVLKAASTAFAQVDRDLEAAARTLRQSEWSVFLRVTLPLAWPGILTGTALTFAHTLGEFGVVLMVGGSIPGETRTISIAIYDRVQAFDDAAAGEMAAVLLALSLTTIALTFFLTQRIGRRRG